MKKIFLAVILLVSLVFSISANAYTTFNTCDSVEQERSFDYYISGKSVKKYSYNSNTRRDLKVCYYIVDGKEHLLKNGATKVIETKGTFRSNFEKIICDDGVKKTIFKWTKNIKMACNFSVDGKRYVLQDNKTKIIKKAYHNTTISKKFKCDNGRVKKTGEWIGTRLEKKSCTFKFNNKEYKLDHNGITTIKGYDHDHLTYKKYICNNGTVKDFSFWRNYTNEVTDNCRFVYRGKYYDLQDNGVKHFRTTVYVNGTKKTFERKYFCEKGVAKIY